MKLILNTHLLLWAAAGGDGAESGGSMPRAALALIDDDDNVLHFSAASIWEVAIKSGLGRDDFQVDPQVLRRGLLDNGYVELPITGAHAAAVKSLPEIHKDPFDRMLVSQAMTEGMILVTVDAKLERYPGPIQRI